MKFNIFLKKYPLVAVFLFVFICLLPACILRDFTPSNELRYLSIADEAISGGHFFSFYNQGEPYADKPPLYIWIVMLCRLLFGTHSCIALTMFSLIPAFVIVAVMDRWVMGQASVTERISMAMMMLTCALFLGTAVVVRMDMLMCMFIVLALYTFWRMYETRQVGESVPRSWGIWLAVWIFMALFTKGPVGLLVPPISIVVFLGFKGKWKEIHYYLGWRQLAVLVGLCAVWFGCVYIDGGASYLDNLLFKQTVGRAVNAFTHEEPFWYYAVSLLWSVAPYTILLVGALCLSILSAVKYAVAKRKATGEIPVGIVLSDKEFFFLSVAGSTFVMLSCFSSKLAVYLVPAFPFIVYLFPMVSARCQNRIWMKWAVAIPAAILLLVGIAAVLVLQGVLSIPAVHELSAEYPFVETAPVKIAAMLLATGNALALWFVFKDRNIGLPVFLIGSSLLLAVYSASGVLSKANAYIGYGSVCSEVPKDSEVSVLFVRRPENMDVYLGRDITDYGKNVDLFMKSNAKKDSIASVTGSRIPQTLITEKKRLDQYPKLRELSRAGTTAFVGPYCVVMYESGDSTGEK